MVQVLKREPELQAYYSRSLTHLEEEISSLSSSKGNRQVPTNPAFSGDVTGQAAALTATPASLDLQGAATDQGSRQDLQGSLGDAILDEQEGMRGSSAEDSDTGDDMDLDEASPTPSHPTRQVRTYERQACAEESV